MHISNLKNTRHQSGITLIELTIALSVAAILLTLATSSMASFRAKTISESARGDLALSAQTALRTALGSGKRVVLCPSSGDGCMEGFDWSHGWIGFVDHNRNRERDPNEAIVTQQNKLDASATLVTSPGRTRIVFQPNGTTAGSNVTYTFCDERGAKQAIALVFNNAGKLSARHATHQQGLRCMAARS